MAIPQDSSTTTCSGDTKDQTPGGDKATPVMLFVCFAASTVLLSLTGAIIFSLFWVISALLVLVATLLVSVSAGMAVWMWGAGAMVTGRWMYDKIVAGEQKLSYMGNEQNKTQEDTSDGDRKYEHMNGEANKLQTQYCMGNEKRVPKGDLRFEKKLRSDDFTLGVGGDRKVKDDF